MGAAEPSVAFLLKGSVNIEELSISPLGLGQVLGHGLVALECKMHFCIRELSFYTGRGGCLSGMAGPPYAYVKKNWSSPLPKRKILVPPLAS